MSYRFFGVLFFFALNSANILVGSGFDAQKKLTFSSSEILQEYGAELHPRCLSEQSLDSTISQKKRGGLLANGSFFERITSLIKQKESDDEAIIESKFNKSESVLEKENKGEDKSSLRDVVPQEISGIAQGLLEQMVPLLVTLHNSQAYTGEDQKKALVEMKEEVASLPKETAFVKIASVLDELEKQPNIDAKKILEIRTELKQIRNQQKSWIPSTTREFFAAAREGVTVVAIVGTLVLAKRLGFM